MQRLKPPSITDADRLLLPLLTPRERSAPVPVLSTAMWRDILARARRQSVHVLVAHRVARDPLVARDLPPDISEACHDHLRKATLLAMILREKLTEVTGALLDRGITPVLLKGASLRWTAYSDPSLRLSRDVDVLVAPDRVQDAYRALIELGYRPDIGEDVRAHETRHHFHYALFREHHVVELHWELVRPGSPYSLPAEGVFRRAIPDPTDVGVMHESHEDQILHAAAQSLSEGFSSLVRICDLDRILTRSNGQVDWDSLCRRARDGRLEPAVDLLLRIGEHLLGTPRPAGSRNLRVPGSVRTGVDPLQPATALVAGMKHRRIGFGHLLRFWLLPGARLKVVWHLVFGHPRDRTRPTRGPAGGFRSRLAGRLRRMGVLALLTAYQLAAFVRRRVDRFEVDDRLTPASSDSPEAAPPVRRESPGPGSP